jgi:hypothetical protein
MTDALMMMGGVVMMLHRVDAAAAESVSNVQAGQTDK